MNKARTAFIYSVVFLAGGLAYCALELLFRARTHFSMFIAGGLCAVFLYLLSSKSGVAPWKKWLAAGAFITTVEFLTGIVVNILLGLGVWDYSLLRMNLLGQICLHFSLFWIFLSIPVIWLFEILDNRLAAAYNNKGDSDYDRIDGN